MNEETKPEIEEDEEEDKWEPPDLSFLHDPHRRAIIHPQESEEIRGGWAILILIVVVFVLSAIIIHGAMHR